MERPRRNQIKKRNHCVYPEVGPISERSNPRNRAQKSDAAENPTSKRKSHYQFRAFSNLSPQLRLITKPCTRGGFDVGERKRRSFNKNVDKGPPGVVA